MKIILKNNKLINPYCIFYNKKILYENIKDKFILIKKLEHLKDINDYSKIDLINYLFDIELDEYDYEFIINKVLGDYKIYNIKTNFIEMEKNVSLKNLNSIVEYFEVSASIASNIELSEEVVYDCNDIKELINKRKIILLKYNKDNKVNDKIYKDCIIDSDLIIYNMKIDSNNMYIDIINKLIIDTLSIEYIDNIILELKNYLNNLFISVNELIDIEQNNILGHYNNLENIKNKCKILINSGGNNGQNSNKRSS